MKNRAMVISLIGRPNVGKSSLFNRLCHKDIALAFNRPGVTRDRHYHITSLDELQNLPTRDIIVVDTGGFYPEDSTQIPIFDDHMQEKFHGIEQRDADEVFFSLMRSHAVTAIKESDLVLFVVDGREGPLPYDAAIVKELRKLHRPFWIVVNKMDSDKQVGLEGEFYEFLDNDSELFTVSCAHGVGVTDFKERLHEYVNDFYQNERGTGLQKGVTPREEVVGRLALVGAPNAGKSTLLNLLVGEQRALVSPIAGTTIDPISGYFDLYFGEDAYKLRGQWKKHENDEVLEQYEELRQNNPEFFALLQQQAGDLDEDDDTEIHIEDEYQLLSYEEGLSARQEELLEKALNESQQDSVVSATHEEEARTEETGHWRSLHIVDTAGIRKKSSIRDEIEQASVYRALRSISECDIVLYMIDLTKGLGHQDLRLIDIAIEKGKSVIICLNKIDLRPDLLQNGKLRKEWLEDLTSRLPWLTFCRFVLFSAQKKIGINRLKDEVKETLIVRREKLGTGQLNKTLTEAIDRNPLILKAARGKRLKLKYAAMIKSDPPTIILFVNGSKNIPEIYRRYLINQLRKQFDLRNTPVHLLFRTGSDLMRRLEKVDKQKSNSEEHSASL